MGVDLWFLIVASRANPVAETIVGLERRSELWPVILGIPNHEVDPDIGVLAPFAFDGDKSEPRWGYIYKDNCDNPLKWVRAGDLAAIARERPDATDYPTNLAAFAYLAALPPDWCVVLYWD